MQLLALPGFVAFFFVSLWVGVRMLAQWGRTRALPELLLGLGVLGIGPVGFGLVMLAAAAGASDPGAPSRLAGLSALAVGGGAAAKAIFNWKIYHPRSRAIAAVAFAAIAVLVVAIIGDALATGFAPAAWMQPGWMLVRQGVQIAVLLWGAGEALRLVASHAAPASHRHRRSARGESLPALGNRRRDGRQRLPDRDARGARLRPADEQAPGPDARALALRPDVGDRTLARLRSSRVVEEPGPESGGERFGVTLAQGESFPLCAASDSASVTIFSSSTSPRSQNSGSPMSRPVCATTSRGDWEPPASSIAR